MNPGHHTGNTPGPGPAPDTRHEAIRAAASHALAHAAEHFTSAVEIITAVKCGAELACQNRGLLDDERAIASVTYEACAALWQALNHPRRATTETSLTRKIRARAHGQTPDPIRSLMTAAP